MRSLDLEGIIFPGDVSFATLVFPSVSFRKAEFYGNADFSSCEFRFDSADFIGADFRGDANFNKTMFTGGGARFTEAEFRSRAFFGDAVFAVFASFSRAHFCDEAEFRAVKIIGDVDFIQTGFRSDASFYDMECSNDANFESARFSRSAAFVGASFAGHANFRAAGFTGGDAGFDECKFGSASFEGVRFTGGCVSFSKARFEGLADFREAQFTGGAAYFRSTQFAGGGAVFRTLPAGSGEGENGINVFLEFDMSNASFEDKETGQKNLVDFMNRTFTASTNFSGVTFPKPPIFHGCELHQDTNFDGAKFLGHEEEGAARAFGTLKVAMAKVMSRQLEAKFYAHEQKSIRAIGGLPKLEYFLSWLYEFTSNYGRSYARPLGFLAVVNLSAWFIYLLIATYRPVSDLRAWIDLVFQGPELGETIRFTLSQLFRPLSVWTAKGQEDAMELLEVAPGFGLAIASFQSLASLVFLGLLTLAVRWRFRRG